MIILVMGVSGSGKTTIARALADRLGWIFADADDFHTEASLAKMQAGQPLTDSDRAPWLERLASWIATRHGQGQDAALACSALKRVYRDKLASAAPATRLVYLNGTAELIASRLARRAGHFMPPSLLESQFQALEVPGPDETPIFVDIDAPVADIVATIIEQLAVAPQA